MLHDLGAGTEFCTFGTDMPLHRLADQLSLLAKYHARFHKSPDFDVVLSGFATWPEFFKRTEVLGFKKLCANGFRAAEAVIPPRLFARENQIWPATLASVERHHHLPHTLVHCDVHLRNWYVTADGRMGLSDWKAWRGHWSRDVAYALATSASIEQRRRFERELITHYLTELASFGGPRVSFDSAWQNYRQQLLSALAWWTVTLRPSTDMPDMQPQDAALEMIRRIAHAIDDLDALDA
jgi:hypothetical protein